MLCFVLINSVSLDLLRVWIKKEDVKGPGHSTLTLIIENVADSHFQKA